MKTSKRKIVLLTVFVMILTLSFSLATCLAAPKKGGELVISSGYYPLNLDPAFAENGEDYIFAELVYSNLTHLTKEFKVEPELAKDWEVSEDGKVWTFYLRKGVEFHNGKELTADDVVYTFERALDPDLGTKAGGVIGPIEKVEKADKYTVKIYLEMPYADMPYVLSKPQISILPRWNDNLTNNPIGTGAFKVEVMHPGQKVVYAKNKNYFIEGKPYLNKVVQAVYPDQSSALSALLSGQVDVVWNTPVSWEDIVKGKSQVDWEEVTSPGYNNIYMMVDREPFDDNRVRKALKYCIDRGQFINGVLNGKGVVGNDHPVSPISPFYNDDLPKRQQNYEKAKKLLREAGYPDGLDLTLYTSESRAGQLGSAIVLKELARPAGINIEVKNIDPGRFWSEVWKKEAFLVSNWFGRPTIDYTLYPYFHSEGVWNYANYENKRVDELLEKGRKTTDKETREKYYDEIQKILYEEGPWLLPYFKSYLVAKRKEVKNYPVYPNKWTWLVETWKE